MITGGWRWQQTVNTRKSNNNETWPLHENAIKVTFTDWKASAPIFPPSPSPPPKKKSSDIWRGGGGRDTLARWGGYDNVSRCAHLLIFLFQIKSFSSRYNLFSLEGILRNFTFIWCKLLLVYIISYYNLEEISKPCVKTKYVLLKTHKNK